MTLSIGCDPSSSPGLTGTDAGSPVGSDAAAAPDAGPDGYDGAVTLPMADGGPPVGVDAGAPAPVECGPIASAFELCEATDDTCSAIFRGGEGCAAVCAAAGLTCVASHEDLDGACAADTSRPALGCADTGHASDLCVCGRAAGCAPRCDGRSCGSDGCGGTCGSCGAGTRCEAGACVAGAGPTEDCSGYPYRADTLLAELVGFGQHTRGGDPSRVYHVTTRSGGSGSGSLRAALESSEPYWIVFDVEGEIDLGDTPVRLRSNKTVDGRGRDVLIDGELIISGARNIILTDLRLTNSHGERCVQDGDVVGVRGDGATTPEGYATRDIWLHHMDMYAGGDGLFDVRGGSRITLSWCHFHDHNKGFLIGMETAGEIEGRMQRITFHHNWFDRITKRGPFITYGWLHFFDNYVFHWYEWAARSKSEAQFLSENNVWEARPGTYCSPLSPCPDPNECGDNDYVVDKRAIIANEAPAGYVRSTGDVALNDAVIEVNGADRVFDATREYPYSLEPTTGLAARLMAETGPRTAYCR
ncbi:MAG: hypothetical protein H6719_18700 [Sandaracinaceae bacterium]|nr:hypothetical protein [Sandaracinaceae bacterium]